MFYTVALLLHCAPSWYHGNISREETESLLGQQEDGVFLIRDSIHFVGDRTLSLCCDGQIDHYRILTEPGGLVSVDGGDVSFPTLVELVEVAMTHSRISFVGFHPFSPSSIH